jgi:pimeloyl-ACP methyl ester carboxylesterase
VKGVFVKLGLQARPVPGEGINRRMKRWRFGVATAALLGLISTVATGAPSYAARSAASPVPVLRWHSCDGGFQCAVARVPLSYRHPDGATINIAVIRHLATDPKGSLGSLFFNAGGPNPMVDQFPTGYSGFPKAITARYSLISFDPRGLGESTPLSCFSNAAAEQKLLAPLPAFFPVGAAQDATWERIWADFDEQCSQHAGPIIDHNTTADDARDMNLLREAVGDPVLNYVGLSYGTLLGATYANLFPKTVGRMIFDGNVNASAWTNASGDSPSWLRLDDGTSMKVLQDFLNLCGKVSGHRCAFSAGSPAATRAKLTTLFDRLQRHSVVIDDNVNTYASAIASLSLTDVAAWQLSAQGLQRLWLASGSHSQQCPANAHSGLAGYDDAEAQLGILCSDARIPPTSRPTPL